MRVASVNEIKYQHRNTTRRDYPREGTAARRIYDRLRAFAGRPADLSNIQRHERCYAIDRLRDDYGCDIRLHKYGWYILAGEWFGSHYHDYVIEAIDAALRERGAA